jgi:hypothetical protein
MTSLRRRSKLSKEKNKTNKNWSEIKSSLSRLKRESLIGLVHDLYSANPDNRAFLHARFGPADDALEPYKKTISRWVNPQSYNQEISISKAKKAISDYKKAIGRPEGIAELSVYFCEECFDFLNSCYIDDEPYYDALVRMFERALKATQDLDQDKKQPFIKRLQEVGNKARIIGIGYGVTDDMYDLMAEYHMYPDTDDADLR